MESMHMYTAGQYVSAPMCMLGEFRCCCKSHVSVDELLTLCLTLQVYDQIYNTTVPGTQITIQQHTDMTDCSVFCVICRSSCELVQSTNLSSTTALLCHCLGTHCVAAGNGGATALNYTSPLLHTVVLSGLTPGTKYYYQVGDGTIYSGTYNFTSLAAPSKLFISHSP